LDPASPNPKAAHYPFGVSQCQPRTLTGRVQLRTIARLCRGVAQPGSAKHGVSRGTSSPAAKPLPWRRHLERPLAAE